MDSSAYQQYLQTKGIAEAELPAALSPVHTFVEWLTLQNLTLDTATAQDAKKYAATLIGSPANTTDTYDALCRYLAWRDLRSLYVAFLEVTDCYGALAMLRDTLQAQHGEEIRDLIFTAPIPPLGTSEETLYAYTSQVNNTMRALLTTAQVRAAWFQVQHGLPKAFWQRYDARQRDLYHACASPAALVDALLGERSAMLKRMHETGTLWYTQPVTDDALVYCLQTPFLSMGEHDGRKGVVVTKVPYQVHKSLHAGSDTMKRYYACHCPLVRQAILNGETLPGDVCYCSLGHASHFLAGLGLSGLEGEVLKSAVRGDARCEFIFYLPEAL